MSGLGKTHTFPERYKTVRTSERSIVIRKRALAHTDIQNKSLNHFLQTRETYVYFMMRCNSYSKIKVE